jgi:Mrp family chromosome partitioning ATPase/capsular polysaccharide biosynthesis protein
VAEARPVDGGRVWGRFVAVLRRRWPVILIPAIVGAAVAMLVEKSNDEDYVASADVYLTRLDVSGQLGRFSDLQSVQPVERWMETQAQLARVPQVAISAVDRSDVDGADAAALLGATTVAARPNADLLTFSVRDADPEVARKLTDAYAEAFVEYRRDLDKATIRSVIDDVDSEIDALTPPDGDEEAQLLFSLTQVRSQLEGAEALQTANATLVRPAGAGQQESNDPLEAAAAGAAAGLVLGVALALLLEAIARKVRTEAEAGERLDLPVLGRVPSRTRQRRAGPGLAMRDRPDSPEAEVYRGVRAAIEVAASPELRTIMVSAVDKEVGDTPVIAANLALAVARTSTRTILVDLDLRHRAVDELFASGGRPGLTEVVAGRVALDAVLVTAWAGEDQGVDTSPDATALLQLLPAGAPPSSVGDFLASRRLQDTLEAVEERAPVVVFHGPPLLGTADALSVCDVVDGLIVVVGLDQARRDLLDDVRLGLQGVVDTLGVIATSRRAVSASSLRRSRRVTPAPSRGARASSTEGATPLGVAAEPFRP